MGVFSMSTGDSYISNPINPNPYVFQVLNEVKVGDFVVARINYPNCTNFEGDKIIVVRGVSTLKNIVKLDPHFTEDGNMEMIARFRPTPGGWNMAVSFAEAQS